MTIKEFKINDKCGLISTEIERMVFMDTTSNQLFVVKPISFKGEVEKVVDDVTCLTFDLNEKLNIDIWRNFDSNIECDGEKISNGEVFDLLNYQNEVIEDLKNKIKELEK